MDHAHSLLGRNNTPKDIEHISCVKLRNIGYAMANLKEMYRLMNGAAISKTIKDHRKSIMVTSRNSSDNEFVSGAFRIFVSHAENIKPLNKNGTSNPYVIVRMPEGTIIPPEDSVDSKSPKDKAARLAPIILKGSACDLFK